MSGLFAVDGKVFSVMSKAADMVLLNLLWLICCIPVVTIGASTTALYQVMLKMARDEESYVCKSFFEALKENFKQSTIIWAVILLTGGVLYFDFYFSSHSEMTGAQMLFIPFALIAFLLVMMASYVFPVLAFFKNRTGKAMKNSLMMAVAHLPYTALILAVSILPAALFFAVNPIVAAFIDIVIGVAFTTWVNAHIFRKLFDKYC